MSEIITNREDIFLGKIAGMDVDISTMTPPVANGTHEKILEKIADRIDGLRENSLPEIEEGDNGKVLGVADGAYSLVSGGGGGSVEPLIVTLTQREDDGFDSDAAYNDIKGASTNGNPVVIKNLIADVGEYYTTSYEIYAVSGSGYHLNVSIMGLPAELEAQDADTNLATPSVT